MSAPDRFAAYLLKEPYHPRSNKHSNALLELFLEDLVDQCAKFQEDAASRRIVYELNQKVKVGISDWNVDSVVGPPARAVPAIPHGRRIARALPATYRIACEAKAIMTEHHKAQRNRLRDLDALHQFTHRYDQNTIVAAVTVVNIGERFRSPLRRRATTHKSPATLAKGAIDLLRSLPLRSQPSNGPGLEANAVIVVSYDNSEKKIASSLHTRVPAPQPGDPLHWDSFIRRICDLYTQRWSR